MTVPILHLANATVIDPSQPDPPRDVFIAEGRIIAKPVASTPVQTHDCTGMTILPGAIDMHTHLVTPAISALRTLQAHVIPDEVSPTLIGSPAWLRQQFLDLGYTTLIDAAIAPGDAPAARLQLREFSPIHTGFLLLLSHHGDLLSLLNHQQWDRARDLATHLYHNSGAMGIKLVNPGSMHTHDGPALDVTDIDTVVNGMQVSPRAILSFFLDLADSLNLAHPIHIHLPQLGTPESCDTTLQWLNAMAGRRAHIAHLQYHCYQYDEDWYLRSGVEKVLTALQSSKLVTADVGLTGFGPAYALTSDLALHDRLCELFGDDAGPTMRFQWDGRTVFGLQPLDRNPQDLGYAMQWATGLELILLCDNLDQLSLSIDYPNGGAVSCYPQLIQCLTNKAYRDELLKHCHPAAMHNTSLASITRELTVSEILQLTRTSPARALGMSDRGNLQIGSSADIVMIQTSADIMERLAAKPDRIMIAGQFR